MDRRLLVVIKKELMRVFTDRRLVFTALLLPGLSIAVIYSIMGMVIGNMDDERAIHMYEIETYNVPSSYISYMDESPYDKINMHEMVDISQLEESKMRLTNESIDMVLVFDENFDQKMSDYRINEIPNIDTYFNPINEYSQDARNYIVNGILQDYKVAIVGERLGDIKFTQVFSIDIDNSEISVASEEKLAGTVISRILPILISIFLFAGAMGIGIDMVAGEKERGTMATILLTPVKRETVALGKLISLAIVAIFSTISSILGILLSFPFSSKLFGQGLNIDKISFPPQYILLLLIALLILVGIYVGLIILVSVISRSVKEAGTYISPIYMVVLISAILAVMGNGEMNYMKYLIPIYGNTIIIQNIFSLDINMMYFLINSFVSILVITGLVLIIRKMFYNEKFMFK
ncbi:MAG: ABC transporter permease [Clostridiales bacterium]|nr:ABC transporter permease [Clostridiales bacterium]